MLARRVFSFEKSTPRSLQHFIMDRKGCPESGMTRNRLKVQSTRKTVKTRAHTNISARSLWIC